MSSIPHGLRIWDGSGGQILGERDFTMRVLGFMQFRDATVRRAPYRAEAPLARATGVAAILTAVEGSVLYNPYKGIYTSTMPSVFVGDGFIEFRPILYYSWQTYKMVFDVTLVKTQ